MTVLKFNLGRKENYSSNILGKQIMVLKRDNKMNWNLFFCNVFIHEAIYHFFSLLLPHRQFKLWQCTAPFFELLSSAWWNQHDFVIVWWDLGSPQSRVWILTALEGFSCIGFPNQTGHHGGRMHWFISCNKNNKMRDAETKAGSHFRSGKPGLHTPNLSKII